MVNVSISAQSWVWAVSKATLRMTPGVGFGLALCTAILHVWYHSRRKRRVTFKDHLKPIIFQGQLQAWTLLLFGLAQSIYPSWLWNPWAVAYYEPVTGQAAKAAMLNFCPLSPPAGLDQEHMVDMCLTRRQWSLASGGALSMHDSEDVTFLRRGAQVAHDGGLVVVILARDIVYAVPTMQDNMDSIAASFGSLRVRLMLAACLYT